MVVVVGGFAAAAAAAAAGSGSGSRCRHSSNKRENMVDVE